MDVEGSAAAGRRVSFDGPLARNCTPTAVNPSSTCRIWPGSHESDSPGPASYGAVHDLLTNPAYAGAFVFGRKRRQRSLDGQGEVRIHDVEVPIEQWSVCIPDMRPRG